MSRKNRNVRRSNDKGRRARQKLAGLPKEPVRVSRRLEGDFIIPDGRCNWKNPARPKLRFATEEKANQALRAAQKRRAALRSGHTEKRVYKCPEGGCGGWHLSAREQFDESLAKTREEIYLRREGIIE